MIEEWNFQDVVGTYIPAGDQVKWDYLDVEQIARDYKIDVPDGVDRQQYIKTYILENLVVL